MIECSSPLCNLHGFFNIIISSLDKHKFLGPIACCTFVVSFCEITLKKLNDSKSQVPPIK